MAEGEDDRYKTALNKRITTELSFKRMLKELLAIKLPVIAKTVLLNEINMEELGKLVVEQ